MMINPSDYPKIKIQIVCPICNGNDFTSGYFGRCTKCNGGLAESVITISELADMIEEQANEL